MPERNSTGTMRVGPSADYLALLRGEIEAGEYVRRVKAEVDARLRRGRKRGAERTAIIEETNRCLAIVWGWQCVR